MNALFQFSRLYSDLRVAEVKLVCCFVREFPSAFTHWFRSISRVGVERLFLSFECPGLVPICDSIKLLKFSLENLSQASSLEHLFLSHCVVLPSPQVRFSSLTTLALRAVVLKCRHLEFILSSCSNLEKLTIEYSKLPYKLRLAGTVKQVVIWRCDGGKEIDLHAEYLHTLECMVWNNVRFFFSFVPMLENVTVCPWWSNSYIFSRGARDLDDQVKFLTLGVFADEVNYSPVEIPTEIEMFRSLRTLSLKLISNYEILHLVEPSELLDACPLLQNFNLVVSYSSFTYLVVLCCYCHVTRRSWVLRKQLLAEMQGKVAYDTPLWWWGPSPDTADSNSFSAPDCPFLVILCCCCGCEISGLP
ncbi:hypothetical protein CQW23_31930 [Capsicum baccatum]|uniref:At1g61320/AtMIF1 LRR domain-containing protein n=1 Tax=Capsicum baccatum TaxID=33114 RepID=A0A2G2V675_CAPBA|nr:hypothetical protein CQW23_31930 [Capsicum baccatum]